MEKPNILLNYVDGMLYLYSDFGYEFSEEENAYQVMSELIQYADYTTLSREGETLIAFSQNRRGGVDSRCCITRKTWTPLPGSACSWQTDFAFLLQLDGDFLPFSMRYWRKGRDFYDILCNQTDKAPCVRGEVEAAAPCGRAALVGRSPISSQPACLAPFSGR